MIGLVRPQRGHLRLQPAQVRAQLVVQIARLLELLRPRLGLLARLLGFAQSRLERRRLGFRRGIGGPQRVVARRRCGAGGKEKHGGNGGASHRRSSRRHDSYRDHKLLRLAR